MPCKAQPSVAIYVSQGQTNYADQKAKLHNRVVWRPSFHCVKCFICQARAGGVDVRSEPGPCW